MTDTADGSLAIKDLALAYGDLRVIDGLSLALPDGLVTTIIGPNACGKSTLLRAMGRLLKPRHGAVYLEGEAIHRLPTKEVARRLGLLAQQQASTEAIVVEDLVRRGRYPHQGFFNPPTRKDRDMVERAMELADVQQIRNRSVDELSGGQRQRAWIAMALAQDTPILLLDEPTTYLDIAHQHEVLSLIRRLNREEGRTIVMVLHDINEAAAVSDRIIALRDGQVVADGPPAEVVEPALLSRIFGVECDVVDHPGGAQAVSFPRSALPPDACRAENPAAMGRLSADRLRLGYGTSVVVEDLSLAIPPGKVTAIVGANACGKSTFLRSLARLLPPRAGAVQLDGIDIREHRPRGLAQSLGVLPQSPAVPPSIVVRDLVASGRYPHLRWYRQWSARDEEAVRAALSATGIADLADRPVEELSGGQRQRVFLSMTLARESPILLLDEPTTFLDIAHQVDVLDLVARANRERGATVVMVLHDLTLACRYADNLVVMKEGRLLRAGPPAELLCPDLVREAFGIESAVVCDPRTGKPVVLPRFDFSTSAPAGT